MSVQEVKRPLEVTGEEAEERRRTNPYLKYIFTKPEIVVEEAQDTLTIPIRSVLLNMDLLTKGEFEAVIGEELVSLLDRVLREKYSRLGAYPKWKYYSVVSAVKIGEVVDILMKHVFNEPPLDSKVEDFTREYLLDKEFKVADQLYDIVNAGNHELKQVVLKNKSGGLDIYASIKSFTTEDRYAVALSTTTDSEGKPVIYATCSCPVGQQTFCKHIAAVLSVNLPEVLGSLEYLMRNKKGKLETYINKWRNKHREAIQALKELEDSGKRAAFEAYYYYIGKYLIKRELLWIPQTKYDFELFKIIWDTVDKGKPVVAERKTKTAKMELVSGKMERIVWTEEMEKAREALIEVLQDITRKFGMHSRVSEWATALVYGMVMSSDYSNPPIILHAVGNIGTFKTTGSRILASYVKIPELVIKGKGEPRAIYEDIILTIAEHADIAPSQIIDNVGGLITRVSRKGDEVEVRINVAFLFSLLAHKEDGLELYNNLVSALKEKYTVSTSYMAPSAKVLDPAQLSNIEDYRYSLLPDEKLGLLRVADVFDNYVVVIDEGSRNPRGLENLLTRMSIITVNEGVRVIIITDNLEPHMEVISNPRYAPLFDRTYMAFTTEIKDELTVMENLFRDPVRKFDLITLMGIKKFVDAIPVSESMIYLIKTLGNALQYKYAIYMDDDGNKFIRPLKRDEKAHIELDAFEGLEFDFIAGGRFPTHTIMMAKFFAFMNKHDKVEIEDLEAALRFTVKSRLVVTAESYSDYKLMIMEVNDRVSELVKKAENVMPRVVTLVTALSKNDYRKANEIFQDLVKASSMEPLYAAATISALELFTAMKDFDIDSLPPSIALTIGEILIQKGDTGLLEGTQTYKKLKSIHAREVRPS